MVGQAKKERKMTWGQVWLSLDLGQVPASPQVQTSMPEYMKMKMKLKMMRMKTGRYKSGLLINGPSINRLSTFSKM